MMIISQSKFLTSNLIDFNLIKINFSSFKSYCAKLRRVHQRLPPLKMIARARFRHFYHTIIFCNSIFQNFILFLNSCIHSELAILMFHISLKWMKFYQKILSPPKSINLRILYLQLSCQLDPINDRWQYNLKISRKLQFFLLLQFLALRN